MTGNHTLTQTLADIRRAVEEERHADALALVEASRAHWGELQPDDLKQIKEVLIWAMRMAAVGRAHWSAEFGRLGDCRRYAG